MKKVKNCLACVYSDLNVPVRLAAALTCIFGLPIFFGVIAGINLHEYLGEGTTSWCIALFAGIITTVLSFAYLLHDEWYNN